MPYPLGHQMKKRILIVEDELGYQELLGAILKKDFDLLFCTSAEDALTTIESEPYDLIICDINLHGMTGFELLAHTKAPGPNQSKPVIVCSGLEDPAVRSKAMTLGAAGYVTKPFEDAAILTLVHDLMR